MDVVLSGGVGGPGSAWRAILVIGLVDSMTSVDVDIVFARGRPKGFEFVKMQPDLIA
jgi:hypothetical protein